MSLLTVDVPATHSGAPITIVGEKPGKDEACWRICPKCSHGDLDLKCRTCDLPTIPRPEGFVGRSGRALTQMAAAAGITAFNKSNVVKCADGGTTSDEFKHYFYETVDVAQTTKSGRVSKLVKRIVRPTAILEIWIDRLRTELLEHQANVVVAAGNEALYALTGLQGIEKYRGSLLESSLIKGQKVIPLIHPAAIFYGQRWEYYYVGIADLRKALRESASASYRAPTYTSIFSPKWDDVLDFIGMVMQKGQRWCLDLETRAGWIACVGLSCGSNPSDISTLCIPIQTTKGPYWKPAEEAMFWKLLATLMRRNPNLVGQNIFGFDLDFLLDYGCEPSGIYMDTMSAFALCYPELPKALDFIVSLYGSLPYYKFEAKTWSSTIPDEQLWTYNSKDTFSTLEISWECEKNLREANLWDLYNDYILPVHWMALELQKRRIPVSVDNRDEAKKIVLEELNRIKVDCQAMLKRYEPELIKATSIKHKKVSKDITQEILGKPITAETFNVGSPQHMQALVFGAMKLPARHKRGSKALTTEEEALMDLIAYYPEKTEDLKLLMYEKHLRKAIDYVTYNLDENGYLAFQISFPGTKSFRFSMSASPRGRGFNAQTPPRWSRFQYVPPNGRVFLSRDLSQVEARVVAVLSMCRGQLNQFADPAWSIHKDLGKAIYGSVPLKDTAQYTAAKSAVHGGNYREGPLKMARSSGVPFKDTK
ncbi:MAG: DNA polymerase, partial [Nitrososphaerales archaeon]